MKSSAPLNRRALRELLFTAPGFEKFCSGVIMYDETLGQECEDGTPFVELLKSKVREWGGGGNRGEDCDWTRLAHNSLRSRSDPLHPDPIQTTFQSTLIHSTLCLAALLSPASS